MPFIVRQSFDRLRTGFTTNGVAVLADDNIHEEQKRPEFLLPQESVMTVAAVTTKHENSAGALSPASLVGDRAPTLWLSEEAIFKAMT
jgi:hypothetical protein